MRKVYRSQLSFNRADYNATVSMGTGVPIGPMTSVTADKFKTLSSFGLFGGGHDGNKFYPEVTAENVIPKPEDFVDIPFRLLTATVVGAHSWKATDFSDTAVLKASISKLEGKPVYPNHDPELYNWLGIVADTRWEEARSTPMGETIPAGINGNLRIDAKTNPNIVRALLVGGIYSNSVTVNFLWVPSHQFDSVHEFEDRIGTYAEDGKMICRKVTEIIDYYESSLVFLGADPYAKLIDKEGHLLNVDVANIAYSKEDEKVRIQYENEKKYYVGVDILKNLLSLSYTKEDSKPPVTTKEPKMNKFLLAFIASFGTSCGVTVAEGITELSKEDEQKLIDYLGKLTPGEKMSDEDKQLFESFKKLTVAGGNGEPASFDEASHDLSTLTLVDAAEYASTKTKINSLTAKASIADSYVSAQREELLRLYKLSVDGKEDEAVVELYKKANIDQIKGFLKQFGKKATGKFSAKCVSCGSEDITMASSEEAEGGEESGTPKTSATAEDFYSKYDRSSFHIGKN